MKIVAVDHSAELGGAEIGLANLAREVGDDMKVVLLQDGPFADRLNRMNVPFSVVSTSAYAKNYRSLGRGDSKHAQVRRLLGAAASLRVKLNEQIEEHQADVVVFNTLRSTMLAATARAPRGIPRIVMIRDGLASPYLSRTETLVAQSAIFSIADGVIANSNWTASKVWAKKRMHVVPPCISREFYRPRAGESSENGCSRVLLLGRVATWKGQLVGLRAAAAVADSVPLKVTVAGGAWFGEDNYMRQLQDFAAQRPNFEIDLIGHVDDVSGLIDAHDVVLHTATVPEPFGQVVVQAMARGKVIIASDAGGPTEIISPGYDGLLHTAGSSASLAKQLKLALTDAKRRRQLECSAVRRAERYHPARVTAEFLSAVSSITASSGRERRLDVRRQRP